MNLFEVFRRFPDHEACIEHLEELRWGDEPQCPYCGSFHVARKGEVDRIGRWNCHDCKSSFNVLAKTIFQKTRVPLQKWFLAISLTINAKKSISSYQLSRDLDINQKTAWYMLTRIRLEMASKEDVILQGIIEADETYIGGKPRKRNRKEDDDLTPPRKRGRGTDKTPVIGAVERGGKVVARVAHKLDGQSIKQFIRETVEIAGSLLITDEYKGYYAIRGMIPHSVINHQVSYADGDTHTNTIEGFWSLLKRAWYGTHHHFTECFTPLYVGETCWKYNNRKNKNAFDTFLRGVFA